MMENAYMVYQRFQRFRALRSSDESEVMVTDLTDEAQLAQDDGLQSPHDARVKAQRHGCSLDIAKLALVIELYIL